MTDYGSTRAFTPDPPEAESVKDADLTVTQQWLDSYAELIAFEEQVLAPRATRGLAAPAPTAGVMSRMYCCDVCDREEIIEGSFSTSPPVAGG